MKILSWGALAPSLIALALAGCQVRSHKGEQSAATDSTAATEQLAKASVQAELLEGEFLVIELVGKDMLSLDSADHPTMHINLKEQSIGGSTGCNTYFGQVQVAAEGAIRFNEVGSTLRACPEGNPEGAFVQALYAVRSYRFDEADADKLQLLDAEGKALMHLQRRKP